jgi:hypothetical protein
MYNAVSVPSCKLRSRWIGSRAACSVFWLFERSRNVSRVCILLGLDFWKLRRFLTILTILKIVMIVTIATILTIFDYFLMIVDYFDDFWRFLTIFDDFWRFLTIFDYFWRFFDDFWRLRRREEIFRLLVICHSFNCATNLLNWNRRFPSLSSRSSCFEQSFGILKSHFSTKNLTVPVLSFFLSLFSKAAVKMQNVDHRENSG